ncbi:MAG: pyridoxal-phosphate dependent enzyme, partial [Cutibacterium avidum]|nr:pyridoxal-phosphate dependent enzyme [Cutibacterium avidum]
MTTTVEIHPETRGTTATSISNLIGHTPLVRMDHLFDGLPFEVYGKLEKLNPGGSIKDRAAQSMIERAIRRG